MFISKDVCPVPFDQQPLNEYNSLKNSCFFSWSLLSINKYLNILCLIFSCLLIAFYPLVYTIFINQNNMIQIFMYDICIINFILISIFIRLYLGWSYIVKRLFSSTIFYEESGWYDGQIWIKNVESITKDRLIGLYEVIPFMNRIKYSLLISIISFILESFIIYLI